MTAPGLWYSVIASLPSASLAAEYVAWLQGGHIDAVIRGGATSGDVVVLDPDLRQAPLPEPVSRVMASYRFPSRQAFDEYVREHAPALRAEGLARFGPSTGVTFQRLVGEIK